MQEPPTQTAMTMPAPMHVYNPVTEPQLFKGVIRKRSIAFLIDAVLIAIFTVIATVAVFLFGIVTFGLGWLLFGVVFPLVGLGYNAITIGGSKSSTIGQRMMGLAVPMWYGGKVTPLVAAFHALLFWFSLTLFFPILLWCFFDSRKRCLHDILAGVLVINRPKKAMSAQPADSPF